MVDKTGRKLFGFLVTILIQSIIVLVALLYAKIAFTGDNIIVVVEVFGLEAGAFFGANVGEYFANRP
jgi:hypothetical protein